MLPADMRRIDGTAGGWLVARAQEPIEAGLAWRLDPPEFLQSGFWKRVGKRGILACRGRKTARKAKSPQEIEVIISKKLG